MREDKQLSSTWPKSAGHRESSTLFHRTNGGSGVMDVSDIRSAGDEEEGRGEGSEAIHDLDSPSPPRVPRKRGGGGVSAARRNGALCIALCVSAASLVWIIARDDTGPAYTGLDTLGPWANEQLSSGKKRTSIPGRVDSSRKSKDLEQGGEKKGDRSKAASRRAAAAEEDPTQQQQRRRSEQAHTQRIDRFTRQQQQQQQQQSQQWADVASVAADALVARDASEVALRAAVSDGSVVPAPAAHSDDHSMSLSAKVTTGPPNNRGREEIERGWRSEAYAGGGAGGNSEISNEDAGGKAVGKTWRAVTGDEEERGSVPAAQRDVEGVGKWGAFEEVPVDGTPVDGGVTIDHIPIDLDIEDKVESETTTALVAGKAAPAVEGNRPKDDNVGSVGTSTTEERPLNDKDDLGAPSAGVADSERAVGGGSGGGYVVGVSDESKPSPDSEGRPPTILTAVASEEIEAEQDLQQRGGQGRVAGERREEGEEDVTPGGISGGAEASAKEETSRKRTPKFEERRQGEEGKRTDGDQEVRVQNESPGISDERETKEATGVPPEAIEARAVALSRAADTSYITKSKEGEHVTSDIAQASAESRADAIIGIREANKRAKEIRASTRQRPANIVEKEEFKPMDGGERTEALPEQAKSAVVAEGRADVRPPSRHADRWEQARKGGGDDGDKSAIGRRKYAPAAAEAALVGVPPLVPGDGGGGGTLTGGGERSGKRGGDSGEGLPCRLEGRVEDWKPPAIADLRSSYRWADEHKASMERIRRFRQGGTALRELIHSEVIRLDVLRHDLFC